MTVVIYSETPVINRALEAAFSLFVPTEYKLAEKIPDVLAYENPIVIAYCHAPDDVGRLLRIRRARPEIPIIAIGAGNTGAESIEDILREEEFDTYPFMSYIPAVSRLQQLLEERK